MLLKRRPAVSQTGPRQHWRHVPKNFCAQPQLIMKTRRQGVICQTCWKVIMANSQPQHSASGMPQRMARKL